MMYLIYLKADILLQITVFLFIFFVLLVEFLKFMNINFVNNVYQNDPGATEFLCSISEVIEKNIMSKLKNSQFFSISIDESTDISFNDYLILYVTCYINNDPEQNFLKLFKLPAKDAQSVYLTKNNVIILKKVYALMQHIKRIT